MGAVENIMGSALIVSLLLIGGITMLTLMSREAVDQYTVEKQLNLNEIYSNDVNAILLISEPYTKRPFGNLLGIMVYEKNKSVVVDNTTINITAELKKILDFNYGENNYFFQVKPFVSDMVLNFVIDGSESLADERQILNSSLTEILTRLKENRTVVARIYILSQDPTMCDEFAAYDCEIINHDLLYREENSTNSSDYRFTYNITPPFGYPYLNWTNPLRQEQIATYVDSDYGAGTAFVANKSEARYLTNFTFIFPISDELATSSFADSCFNVSRWSNWTVCGLCQNDSPLLRANTSIQQAVAIAKEKGHIISPIFSFECNYEYHGYNTSFGWNLDYYNIVGVMPNTSACALSECGGCTEQNHDPSLCGRSDYCICFHPEASSSTLSLMNEMASATGGKVIDLKNIALLPEEIIAVIDKSITEYEVILGEKKNQTRLVQKRLIPLPNRLYTEVNLWVYLEGEGNFTSLS